jgi:hypothetical protein
MTRRPWQWLAVTLIASGLLVAGIAVGLVTWAEKEGLEIIQARLAQAAPWLLVWRIAVFAILIVYWRELAGWVSRRCSLDEASCAALVQWRWRAAVWILLLDLVLAEDLIGLIQRGLA